MFIVNFWHAVSNYDEWKKLFDSDPLQRQKSGVRSYYITRPPDYPNYVVAGLEFDSREKAEAFLTRLRELWGSASAKNTITDADGRIMEIVENKTY
jgi:hypothetical protein